MMFIIYTILAWLANASALYILHGSIQDGQILHWWGDKLLEWDRKNTSEGFGWYAWLSKAGGLCEFCFSYWWSLLFTPLYIYAMYEMGLWQFGIVLSIIWFFVYHSIATVVTIWTLKNI